MPWWFRSSSSAEDAVSEGEEGAAAAKKTLVFSPGNHVRPVSYRDLAFVPSTQSDTYWIEGLTLTCFLENGDFMLFNFVLSTMPFSSNKATLNLKFNPCEEGAPPVYFQKSCSRDDIDWSEDLCSAEFDDGSFFRYNDHIKSYVMRVVNDHSEKTAAMFRGAEHITLTFVADAKSGLQVSSCPHTVDTAATNRALLTLWMISGTLVGLVEIDFFFLSFFFL